MLDKVRKFIVDNNLLLPGEKVLVGISGGADSVATLLVLCELCDELGFWLSAAHLNHGFRGEESAEDAEFVRNLCNEKGIPCEVAYRSVPALIETGGGSKQQVARATRFDFFLATMAKFNASVLVLGHNINDQAETVLLHLVRGSGPEGLVGMKAREFHPYVKTVVRPLLSCSRSEIERYLHEIGQPFRVDSSNLQCEYTRNALRLKVMPLLEGINPNINQALTRLGELTRDESEYLDELVEKLWQQGVTFTAGA
ncbi:MAG: tRNA lysidine(34) synthetase TilS, partial [bacterium]|nr:tRNA lysidine(34) synthetase TilS [bacterium]